MGGTVSTHFLSLATLLLAALSTRRSDVLSVLDRARVGSAEGPEETCPGAELCL